MVVIAFLLTLGTVFSIAANEHFSSEQREEAQTFIRTCFERIERIQQDKQKEFKLEAEQAGHYADRLLSAEQIDYKKYHLLETQKEICSNDMLNAETYEKSLNRPKEKIVVWDEARESEARALQAYMVLSDEWQQYKKDPLNERAYQMLHQQMQAMAHMIVRTKGKRVFVGGTHAYPSESDEHVNYDVDRVFFLTLYLLEKELHAGQCASASSSQ